LQECVEFSSVARLLARSSRVDQLTHVFWRQFSRGCTSFQMARSIAFVSFAQILVAHHTEKHSAINFSTMR
jgi:hypothetical protein